MYELLTGSTPLGRARLKSEAYDRILQLIREEEPPRPSARLSDSHDTASLAVERRTEPRRLSLSLRGDLDAIVMKALEKNRNRRYDSATGMATDIERYLTGEPITARPPSASYVMTKFARRHRSVVVGLLAVLMALALGAIVSATFAYRELTQRRRAEANLTRAREAEQQAHVEADSARNKALTAERVSDFLVELFEVADRSAYRGNTITAREVLDLVARRIAVELQSEPAIQAKLMETMGRVYQNLGLYGQAEALLDRSIAARRDSEGRKPEDIAGSLFRRAELHHYQHDYAAAERGYRAALELQRDAIGPDHAAIAQTLDLLGRALQDQANFDGALEQCEEALEMRKRLFGEEHVDVTESYQSLGMLAMFRGESEKVAEYFQQALEMRRKILGPEHAEIPELLYALGGVSMYSDSERSEKYLREALALTRKLFGDVHPNVAHSLDDLGVLANNRKDYDGAEALYREAMEIHRQMSGEQSLDVAVAMHNLGTLMRDKGNLDEALRLLGESKAIKVRILGKDHVDISGTNLNLGWVHQVNGDYAEAETEMLRAYEIRKTALGTDIPKRTPDKRSAVLKTT